jgi:sigma54-dependent transcription regulator
MFQWMIATFDLITKSLEYFFLVGIKQTHSVKKICFFALESSAYLPAAIKQQILYRNFFSFLFCSRIR